MSDTLLYRRCATGFTHAIWLPESLVDTLAEGADVTYAAVLKKVGKFTVALTIRGDHKAYCREALAVAHRHLGDK